MGPIDPLDKLLSTVAKLFDTLWISLHIEFRDDDVFEFDEDVFEISKLNVWMFTMVSHML